MIKVKDGYAKLVGTTASGSASHILLSNGGIKAVSDFVAVSALDNYLPLSGGTMGGNIVFQGGYLRFTNSSGSFLGAYNVNDSGEALYLKGSAWNKILHSGNYSNYALPLSGGQLKGSGSLLSLNRTDGAPYINFRNNGVDLGDISVSDAKQPQFYNGGWKMIWHEGNDGSGSGLDADLLDGKHASAFALASHGVHWEGFTKRANSNASWGTLIASNGYTPLFWLDSNNTGGVAFSDYSGQTFMQIDGYFYQNEGKNRVTDITETVTALGTSGNYLTWTKNGTTNNITIPYASSAGALGNYSIQHFMTYDNGNSNYLAASFTNENFSKKAAEKYIEYWDSTGGWFNSRWGQVQAISGFHRVGSSDSYVLLGGGGHKLESNLSVNYAASTGNADTVDSCHKDDFLRRTATQGFLNKFVLEDIPKGVTQVGSIGWTDYQNYPHAGGLWMTLRGTSSLSTALILFPSYSMSSPPILYSSIDGGAWQGGYQLAYMSQIPTTMAWGSITGKPSTFTPSTHYHNYFPENTAVYFRDPNASSWRGGMYWGSAGNEALCFVAVNANTSFRFFTGSDIANWTSSTWQGTPAFEVNKNGAYAPHFYESSDIRYKTIINNLAIKANQLANLPLFDFKWQDNEDQLNTGTSAQAVQELLPYIVSGTDKLTLDYGVLGTIAGITACKELTEQEKEINELKEQIKFLKDEINNLKTNKLWQS